MAASRRTRAPPPPQQQPRAPRRAPRRTRPRPRRCRRGQPRSTSPRRRAAIARDTSERTAPAAGPQGRAILHQIACIYKPYQNLITSARAKSMSYSTVILNGMGLQVCWGFACCDFPVGRVRGWGRCVSRAGQREFPERARAREGVGGEGRPGGGGWVGVRERVAGAGVARTRATPRGLPRL